MAPSSTVPPQANFDLRSDERAHVHVFRVESFDDRYLLTVPALVDADADLLGLFRDVLADAEFLGQSARRADFRHYGPNYKMPVLNSVGSAAAVHAECGHDDRDPDSHRGTRFQGLLTTLARFDRLSRRTTPRR